ncbi:hypothetical protein PBY51_023867 [Eleginops maclovinus]|uniref:Uncharacterized protein n=1 Tax=Eleginops maclovinus TaxID=56733 RepID=A0AAN7X0P4_ELEMC|nr:hypothetical protein PBY51_023867 [Eleginops maclovinus]
MKREEPRSSGRGARRKGRKMAAGSLDQCFPDWAYGHSSSSLPSVSLPALPSSGSSRPSKCVPHTSSNPFPDALPWGYSQPRRPVS